MKDGRKQNLISPKKPLLPYGYLGDNKQLSFGKINGPKIFKEKFKKPLILYMDKSLRKNNDRQDIATFRCVS